MISTSCKSEILRILYVHIFCSSKIYYLMKNMLKDNYTMKGARQWFSSGTTVSSTTYNWLVTN